jgi:cag pathogenicity island protein 25
MIELCALVFPMVDIPPIQPSFDGPGAAAGIRIVGQIAGYAFIAAIVGMLISGAFVAVGHISKSSQLQKGGLVGLVSCIAGAAICGSAVALVQFGANIPLL